eukprot:m.14122 g.14122  ORF g.14122 m.14122 type:complete len:354 (-) comp2903_c0_seq1:452-1513(-)
MSAVAQSTWLLGTCDGPIHADPDCGYWTNKLGGVPDAMPGAPVDLPTCEACGERMALVLQVYAPLPDTVWERTIYVCACTSTGCPSHGLSWRAFRAQMDFTKTIAPASASAPALASTSASASVTAGWGAEEDDWGDEGPDSLAGAVASITMGAPTPATAKEEYIGPPSVPYHGPEGLVLFQPMYITVFEEPKEAEDKHAQELLRRYTAQGGTVDDSFVLENEGGKESGGRGTEGYEKIVAAHGDRGLERLLKRIAACPQQCVRYCFGGTPLVVSSLARPMAGPPPACACGSPRVCEVQLLSTVLPALKLTRGHGGLDFATAVVYTCAAACGQGLMEEYVWAQADPDAGLAVPS